MKFSNIFAVAMFSTSLLVSTVFASNTGIVTSDSVNVRAGATTDSSIVTTLNKNDTFIVTGEKDGFYSFFKDDNTYFVSKDFAKVSNADGTITGDNVNVRTMPTANAPISGTLAQGTPVNVVGQVGNWYQIDENGVLSFVSKDFVAGECVSLVGEPTAITSNMVSIEESPISIKYIRINANGGLNLRDGASESSNKIATIPNGTKLESTESKDGFLKVTYNGSTGYVKESFTVEYDPNAPVPTGSELGTSITDWAKQYIGTPYVYGGTSLTKGVDCSGFTTAVFRDNPYKKVALNRVASDQYNNGTRVSKSELLPGDLVFFDTNGGNNGAISHAGIYIGNGQFIHSSSGSTKGIIISDLTSGFYYNGYVGATRVLS